MSAPRHVFVLEWVVRLVLVLVVALWVLTPPQVHIRKTAQTPTPITAGE